MNQITMNIDGMSCGHCATSVRKALQSVTGVAVQQVAVGTATVEYDPAVSSFEKIAEAVGAAGYSATPAA